MRTTLALDDELVEQASFYTGIHEKSALVTEALRALVHREVSRQLIALGGSDPKAKSAPRRRLDNNAY
jgi:Arc/MetJ family transcription regulator